MAATAKATKKWARRPTKALKIRLLKGGHSIIAAGDELQNLDRVEAGSKVIGREAISCIEYSSDESAIKYRGTRGDRFRFGHNHLHAPFLVLVSVTGEFEVLGSWRNADRYGHDVLRVAMTAASA